MFRRPLGRSGIEISAMGMGCWAIGGPWAIHGRLAGWGEVDDTESIRAIHRAMDLGIDFFDTAANYGCGHSERILGRALAGRREGVVVATKFGYLVDEESMNVEFYGGEQNSGLVVENLRLDCQASLRRLGVERIDLYQFHINQYAPVKAAAVRDALEDLVAEGLIRSYGWSTDNPEGALVFAQRRHCVAIQHELNVVRDAPEMLDLCERSDLASVNRGPLARGVFTGKYTAESSFAPNDLRSMDAYRQERFLPHLAKLEAARGILTSGGRTPAQGALAWIWARSGRTIPIPGIRTAAQAEENAGAMRFGPLSDEQMREIGRLLGS